MLIYFVLPKYFSIFAKKKNERKTDSQIHNKAFLHKLMLYRISLHFNYYIIIFINIKINYYEQIV